MRCARPSLRGARAARAAPTAVSCCGANPGMVSWFVKQALLDLASATSASTARAADDREDWAGSCRDARRQGHPHRRARHPARQTPKPHGRVRQHLVGRGLRLGGPAAGRARLGHAREMDAGERPRSHDERLRARRSICCSPAPTRASAPGARRPVRNTASSSPTTSRSRSPTTSPCARAGEAVYRPTCHYAYHPCNDAVLSLHEMFGRAGERQDEHHILDENEIVDGIDELGVLLYGHDRNAYWYGSQLSDRGDARARALPERHRPAGDLGGARRHGLGAGEPERRHRRGRRDGFPPLPRNPEALSRPGRSAYYTDWTPLDDRPGFFPEDIDTSDPWQFRNVLVR